MGLKVFLPTLAALALVSGIAAVPFDDFRSEFELRSTNIDDPKYRLKDNIQPTYQYVDLDVYLDENRFDGVARIEINVLESNISQIVLHQNLVSISAVTVLNAENQPVALQFPTPFEIDSYYEIVHINLAQAIDAGTYTITISYVGRINENPIDRGLYKGYYFQDGEKKFYATTQFQPYHARKAFPCFDEPQFKNRFVISITRSSDLGPSYSNMAINETQTLSTGRIRETFLPTPVISAYLVAFHISDFIETTSTGTAEKPFGIISRPGVTLQHQYPAQIGMEITAWMDEYFDYPYYSHGDGVPMKNDHIALPDFPSGAMENWGMVNYREAYLLYDPDHTNTNNQIFVATIMAHELAHKWFGNLVTCFWWSNLWLNESFASFYEYFATHGVAPELELNDQFIVDYVQSALSSDASAGATPMNWTGVVDNLSISSHFSVTSYAKGASVLRMMEHLVGAETFKKAQQYYLSNNAYGLGTPELMYAAFRQAATEDDAMSLYPGVDVGDVFDTWVQNPGAPVIQVDVDMSTGIISVSQQRFQLTGTVPDTLWYIPLTFTRGGNINFEDTKPVAVMTERTLNLTKPVGHEWVIFNVGQSGLYRVNYDDHTWEMIAAALRNNRESIDKINRAQIVNDILFFIRAGTIDINLAFNVLSFLENETDYYVWAAAITQLDYIKRRVEHIPVVHQEFSDYFLGLMETAIQNLGYDELISDSTSTKLNRFVLMNYACNNGHQGCIDDSLAKWETFKNDRSQLVQPNLRRHVYCTGARYGDQSDYDLLWELYSSSENAADMVIILRAMACTRDQSLVNHYLEESITNDLIRIHDKTNAFSFALLGNPENLPTVLNFVYTQYEAIREGYGGTTRLNIALSALVTYLTDFEDIVAFQSWLYSQQNNLDSTEFSTGVAVINTSINNLEWGNNVALDLISFLRSSSSAPVAAGSVILMVIAAAINMLR